MQLMARNSVVERTWEKINKQLLDHYTAIIKSPVYVAESESVA